MTITGIVGDIGSGKSLEGLRYAIEQANMKKKRLITNFDINIEELIKYAYLKRYYWIVHIAITHQISVVDSMKDITEVVRHPNCIVLLDEAGIFLNSRDFSNTPKELLMNLAQSRKMGVDLIWMAQFDDQVDKQFRKLTQYFIHAEGTTAYDRKLGRPKLHWKTYYYFKAGNYQRWQTTEKARFSFIRTWIGFAFDVRIGWLGAADRQLFKVFDSFTQLEKQGAKARSFPEKIHYQPHERINWHQTAHSLRRIKKRKRKLRFQFIKDRLKKIMTNFERARLRDKGAPAPPVVRRVILSKELAAALESLDRDPNKKIQRPIARTSRLGTL